ncbi:MAG TPA: dienelactone hydrolase family protein [Polyangia bacterium]
MIACEWMSYGKERGFLARPDGAASLPGIVVLQEAWGVDEHLEDVTRRFAAAGYVALAPDLFAEGGARPAALERERMLELQRFMNTVTPAQRANLPGEIARLPEPERTRVGETFQAALLPIMTGQRKLDGYLPKLLAATHFLRAEHAVSRGRKIGSVGFCMGGGLSALLACHDPELGAAVIFYGSAPPAEAIPNIACPVLGLYGALDERVNAGLPAFREAMARADRRLETQVYEGAQHAFFNDNRPSYHPDAARDAFVRTLELFRRTLV